MTTLHVLLLWGQALLWGQTKAAFQPPPFLQTLSDQTWVQRQEGVGEAQRVMALSPALLDVPNARRLTPRRRHLKTHKLLKRLRKDWDPFWMSAQRPADPDEEVVKQAPADPTVDKALQRLNFTLRGQELSRVVQHVLQAWLMQRATCHVRYAWQDLGVLYWPRWVRRGLCQAGESPPPPFPTLPNSPPSPSLSTSCSWPPGMHCVPAQSRRIRILRWQCRHKANWRVIARPREGRPTKRASASLRDPSSSASNGTGQGQGERLLTSGLRRFRGDSNNRTEAVEETNNTERWSGQPGKGKGKRRKLNIRCKWKKIPYPVTDDCFCSC